MDVKLPPTQSFPNPAPSAQGDSASAMPGAAPSSRPNSAASPSPWPPQRNFETQYDLEAAAADELYLPTILSAIIGEKFISPFGALKYVENQLKAAVQKTDDPIERLLIQQILLLHYRLVQLHNSAAGTDSLEGVKIYNAAAARLTGEYRRMILTLHQYRAPYAGKSIAFIKQQNVAQTQEVQLNQRKSCKKKKLSKRSKQEDADQSRIFGGRFAGNSEGSNSRCGRKEAAALER